MTRNGAGRVRHSIERIIGRIHWRPPPWLAATAQARRERPRRFWGIAALILALPLAALLGIAIWQSLPEPVLTQVRVSAPDVTPIGEGGKLYPQPVTLRFETRYPDPTQEGPRSAARLALLGKTLEEGIRLEPAHPGQWQWVDENTLRFTPSEDWPAGQRYTVQLTPSLFAPGIELADAAPAFVSPEIEVEVRKLDFYQNPEQPLVQQVVATLAFTQPVDPDSLKAHLALTMRPSDASIEAAPHVYDYSVRFDEHGRRAYVTSEPLTIPERENFMTLTLQRGIEAARGPSATDRTHRQEVRIPARSTFFRVESLQARIVRNASNRPQQTLLLTVTDGIRADRVAARIEAYLLPADQQWRRGEVTPRVLAGSEPITLHANPTEHPYARLLSFRFQAPPGRQMLVRLPAGLVSRGGFTMTVPYRDVLTIPDYPAEARIVGEGGLLALSGDRTIALQARGVPALRVQAYRLLDRQLVHLVTQTRGDLEQADFTSYGFDEDNIGRRLTRVLPLNAVDPSEAVYASLDLSGFLDGPRSGHGMFVVTVTGWDPEHRRAIPGAQDRRFLLVTDLAVIAKNNADHSHDLFVHSLATEAPVAGARVALLGVNGRPVFHTTTDARGHARVPDVRSFGGPREPAVYLVRHDGDVSFLPFHRADRKLNFSRFEVGGLRTAGDGPAAGLRAAVFTDRGIYRPGGEGHLGVIVKRNDWGEVAGLPVVVVLRGPRGDTVRRERVALPGDGFLELPMSFGRTDPTGTYRAVVYLLDGDRDRRFRLGGVAFRVEAFQPDSLRIAAAIAGGDAQGWRTGLEFQGQVRLENLFGLPAQKHRVAGRYTLIPTRFAFDEYPGFVFADPYRDRDDRLDRQVTRELPDQRTDSEGRARFGIDLSQYGRGLYRLVFQAEGFETGGGNSVSARTSIRVSPAERLVGWKTDANLDYLRRGSQHRVRFIAINPQARRVAAHDLTLRLVERRPVSTLVRREDGTLAYQMISKRVPVAETAFAIGADGSRWQIPTDTPGDYVAELVDDQGRVLASVTFTVAGARNLAGTITERAQLRIDLDRQTYRPGDRIELQITAPYSGAGLITIERDRVYAFKWFSADRRRTVQHIRVPEGLEANAYVNVTFVRALDAAEIFTQPLSYAVAPFAIDRSPRTMAIELHAPARVEPGQTLPIHFQTSRPGRIVVYAVDAGILQVAGYDTPSPLDFFLHKRALEVGTAQIADLLMPEYELLRARLAPGGGEQADARRQALNGNLNPFQRNVRAPVVFWSGIIAATGEPQTLHFPVPDYFDGRLRLMAVAVADQAVGAADSHTLVRGPFVLQPNAITKAAPGDEFRVSVGVTNALPSGSGEAQVTVWLTHDEHLEIVGDRSLQLTLAPGREGRATFRVRASGRLGAAELVFHAQAGEHNLQRTVTLSVRPAVPHRTTLVAGTSTSGEAEIALPRELQPALAEQGATVGYSPLILADGLIAYLRDYPHACSEQLISRVFPLLGLLDAPAVALERGELMARYGELLAALRVRQLPGGGFVFWPGAGQASPFVSIYAMHFLTDAADRGMVVPRRLFDIGLDYLRGIAAAEPGRLDPYLQAYAIYVLTRNGRVTTSYLTRLQTYLDRQQRESWRPSLTGAYMATSYRLLQLTELAGEIIARYESAEPGSGKFGGMHSALAQNAQFVYLLARHFPARMERLGGDRVPGLAESVAAGRFNTLSSAYSLLALGAWADTAEAPAGLLIGGGIADGGPRTLAEGEGVVLRAAVPLEIRRLHFEGDAGRRLFYTATQSGYDRRLPDQALQQGLEIIREYLNHAGEVVTRAELGAELEARIRVRALDGRQHRNVAIVDLLPAGFAVQRDSLRDGAQRGFDYADIREDRVVFYGPVGPEARTITYRVKLNGAGEFVVPPVYAAAMYDRRTQAHSQAGHFTVTVP